MNKSEIAEIINDDKTVGFLATTDGSKPRCRPISAKYFFDKLLFSTFSGSEKMKQIADNPNVEMTWMFQDMSHLRFEGKIVMVDDMNLKKEFLDFHPMIKQFFKSCDDPNYALLEIKPSRVYLNKMGDMNYVDIDW